MKAIVSIIFFGLWVGLQNVQSQQVISEVPDQIDFGGLKLRITEGGKKVIREDIIRITKDINYSKATLEMANLYFPIMDRILSNEGIPTDFKFLSIQESKLNAQAVSKSNAVGFWQFKKESAIEVGLRVDQDIDERMNLVSATVGAARYLKRSNAYFKNWAYSLLSYNLGLTGAKPWAKEEYIGANEMVIDEKMHWYVMRFLAHKLVYQHELGNSSRMEFYLIEYQQGAGKSLMDIAIENNIDQIKVKNMNVWLKVPTVPSDKTYTVMLPVPIDWKSPATVVTPAKTEVYPVKKKEKFPSADQISNTLDMPFVFYVNGLQAIQARKGDNLARLAYKGGITREEFIASNELNTFDEIIIGRIYYLESKKAKALVIQHVVKENESLWDIAQNYGMKMDAIRHKNRMYENEALRAGRVLWLRSRRPAKTEVEYIPLPDKKTNIVLPEPERLVIDTLTEIKKDTQSSNENIPVESMPANTTKVTHKVATGETVYSICRLYNIKPDQLLQWNGMADYSLKIDQVLTIYKPLVKEQVKVHTVSAGETIFSIARMYNVSVQELLEWNHKTDSSIKPGEQLVVKK